ncbi:MAG: Pantothenate kinase [Rickettsiales bacterium]|jgi:type III pantothenate kinase|nr:Pantothenate kinase [Rickettsiales bacterium]
MLLTIDAGNTNTVCALFDKDLQKHAEWRVSTDARRTADDYAVWLMQLMQMRGFTPADVTGVMIASVVPRNLFDLKQLAHQYFNTDPVIVGETFFPDMPVKVDNPREVGADRIVDAYEARATYGIPVIIVDFGTATTFDVVDGSGAYCGGAIAPGVHLSMEALGKGAAKLSAVSIARPPHVIGRNTEHAIQSGIYFGYAELVSGMIRRQQEALKEMGEKEKVKIVATGGLAPLFERDIPIDHIDADLTIRGLARLYFEQKK